MEILNFLKFFSLLKKSFFSQTRPWANKSKILPAGLPEANRIVFETDLPGSQTDILLGNA